MKNSVLLLALAVSGISVAQASGGLGHGDFENLANVGKVVEVNTANFAQAPVDAFEQYEATNEHIVDADRFKQPYDGQG